MAVVSRVSALPDEKKVDQKVMKVAKEFEENFMITLWDLVSKDVLKDSSSTEKIYSSWLNAEHAKLIAPKVGLADDVYRYLMNLQRANEE